MAKLEDLTVNLTIVEVAANSIYISGPMTGIPLFNRPAFERAAREIASRQGDITVFNPGTIMLEDPTWENYMRVALTALLKCEAVYVLKGWEDSKGAKLELQIAQALGMRIIYEC